MKGILISLAVAVVVIASDFSVVLAESIPIGQKRCSKASNGGEVQIEKKYEQLAFIIYGSPRRRNYEAKIIKNLA